MVMFALPQILLIGSKAVDATSFAVPKVIHRRELSGRVMVNGVVTGEIHGTVNGIMRATVDGDVDLNLISGDITNADREKMIPAHTGEEAEHEHQA